MLIGSHLAERLAGVVGLDDVVVALWSWLRLPVALFGLLGQGVDDAQLKLLYNVYLANRWFLNSAVMVLVTYPMLAYLFRWWMPDEAFEWGLIVAGTAGFVSSLPTVIWGWLEPGTHNRPYPADEDLD